MNDIDDVDAAHRAYRRPPGGMKGASPQITASRRGAARDVVRRLAAADGGVR